MERAELSRSLAMAHRILFVSGHEHLVYGHASARLDADRVLVKARGLGLQEVTPEDIAEMDLEGRQLAGRGRLHSEMPLHTEIYRARPDVRAIVHTHPLHAVSFSLIGRASIAGGAFSQDDSAFARDGIGWYPSAELVEARTTGRALARALGTRRAIVLANHGIAAVGGTIVEATVRAVLLERALRLRAQALAIAGSRAKLRPIGARAAARMAEACDKSQPQRDMVVWSYLEREAERVLGAVRW